MVLLLKLETSPRNIGYARKYWRTKIIVLKGA